MAQPRGSFLERRGRLLLAVAGGIALLAIVGFLALNAAQPAYACAAQWTAPATDAPAAGASPRVGYVQPDLGKNHIATGQKITYPLCPPASGPHYNAANVGPIAPKLYGPDDPQVPEGWLHNLEHGGIVILYRCPGDACNDAGQAAFRQLYQSFPTSPICGFGPTQTSAGLVVARFDQMAYPMLALLWGQVLPLQTLDLPLIESFFAAGAERTNPEPMCARPTASPAPTRAASPSPSAASSSTSATPGATAGGSPVASPNPS